MAATARSAGGSGVIDHPQPGQNAALAGMTVPQCGHFMVACAGFARLLSALSFGLDKSASIPLLSAFFANTINLECVASGYVMVFASYFLLDFADFLGEKFDRSAAFGADHVVMTAAVVLVLITGDAVVEGDFAGQSATGEELQRAVNGGEADARVGFLDQAVQFVGGEMFAGFEEGSQNRVTLFGLF